MLNLEIIYTLILILICNISHGGDFACKKQINGTVKGVKVTGTYDLCDFVKDSNDQDGYWKAIDNRTYGNIESGGDAVNYTFYFNILSNVARATPDAECDNYNKTYRQQKGLDIGYCKDITWEGLTNATCKDENIVPIKNMVAAYQAKKGSGLSFILSYNQ